MSQIIDGWIVLKKRRYELMDVEDLTVCGKRSNARWLAKLVNESGRPYGIRATVRKCRIEVLDK